MPAGQPTKYKPELAELVVKFCAQGFSLTAFAGSIGVARDTIAEWGDKHPEFSEACKRAKSGSAYWWEKKALQNADRGASGGQVAMCIFMLKNHAPDEFRDRMEVTGKDGASLSLELLLRAVDQPKTIEHESGGGKVYHQSESAKIEDKADAASVEQDDK